MKKITLLVISLYVAIYLSLHSAAQDMVCYSKGTANDSVSFNDVVGLSDGTILVSGYTKGTLNWTGVTPTLLDTTGCFLRDTIYSSSTGFILHLSSDLQTILHVVALPAGTFTDIYKIKTTNEPGQPTGDMYISGRFTADTAFNGRKDNYEGYYIARLSNNFVSGVPGRCRWIKLIPAKKVDNFNQFCHYMQESYHRAEQPWDVDNLGRVTYTEHTEFTHGKWVRVSRLDADGSEGAMTGAFYNTVYTHYDNLPHDGKDSSVVADSVYFYSVPADSAIIRLVYKNISGNDSVVYRKMPADSIHSSYMFKIAGTGGRSIRSLVRSEFIAAGIDENGNYRNRNSYPMDHIYKYPYWDPVNYPTKLFSVEGPGFFGQTPGSGNMWMARIGDIAIDRRNNNIYLGLSYATINFNFEHPEFINYPCVVGSLTDFECAVMALNANGEQRWWARTYRLDSSFSGAAQFIDRLAIDYAHNRLVVLARGYDTATNNFFEGDKLKAHPGGHGVLNRYPGNRTETEYSWLAKYNLDTLKIHRSTYIAEYDSIYVPQGTVFTDANLDGWINPNTGTPKSGRTVCTDLKVDEQGNVYVACTGERTITTRDALQKMIKPDQGGQRDSACSINYFVRKYNSDLSEILYSSLLTGEWDTVSGKGGNNTWLRKIFIHGNSILAAGSICNNGNSTPLTEVPSWATHQLTSVSGMLARFDLREKLRITGYRVVMVKNKIFNVSYALPPAYSLSPSNQFKVQVSDASGLFNTSTEVGSITSATSGSINISLPNTLPFGKLKMRVISTDSNLYSNPVTIYILDTLRTTVLNQPTGDSTACAAETFAYRVNNPGVATLQWALSPDTAATMNRTGTLADTTVNITWNSRYNGIASLSANVTGISPFTGNDTILYSDTLYVKVTRVDATLIRTGDTLIARPNGPGYSFIWYKFYGHIYTIAGETDSMHIIQPNEGGVSVKVTAAGGCYSYTNEIETTGNPETSIKSAHPVIYPNPNNGTFTLLLPRSMTGRVRMDITDAAGRLVHQYQSDKPAECTNAFILMPVSSPGIYLLRYVSENTTGVLKFIIR